MPQIITGAYLDALFTGFKSVFNDAFKGVKPKWQRCAMEVSSSTSIETYAWLGQMPRIREWIGDRQINSLDTKGYVLRNRKFESTVGVPRTQIEDDVLGIFNPMIAEMGRSAAAFPDELVFLMALAGGFTQPCYDGQNFFDSNHPVLDGNGKPVMVSNLQAGTGPAWYLMDTTRAIKPLIFQNRKKFDLIAKTDPRSSDSVFNRDEVVYGVDGRCNAGYGLWQLAFGSKQPLNTANFRAALTAMMATNGDGGRPLGIVPNLLVVPNVLWSAARDLIFAEKLANGASNTDYKLVDIEMVEWLPNV